jgi:hypothetical protein
MRRCSERAGIVPAFERIRRPPAQLLVGRLSSVIGKNRSVAGKMPNPRFARTGVAGVAVGPRRLKLRQTRRKTLGAQRSPGFSGQFA